ncbi:MAG: hypothetical protein K1W31_00295 [Lachnospiraceae bacterium]
MGRLKTTVFANLGRDAATGIRLFLTSALLYMWRGTYWKRRYQIKMTQFFMRF